LVDDHAAIQRKILGKARKYGVLDRPYVIAIMSTRSTSDRTEFLQALFGVAWEHPEMLRNGSIASGFAGEGAWLTHSEPKRRGISAVLVGSNIQPWSVGRQQLLFIPNPWALLPLEETLPFAAERLDLHSGAFHIAPARLEARQILGLAETWPPGAPFPR
jgi:hypothetical protein